jgi:hypothetical protein
MAWTPIFLARYLALARERRQLRAGHSDPINAAAGSDVPIAGLTGADLSAFTLILGLALFQSG